MQLNSVQRAIYRALCLKIEEASEYKTLSERRLLLNVLMRQGKSAIVFDFILNHLEIYRNVVIAINGHALGYDRLLEEHRDLIAQHNGLIRCLDAETVKKLSDKKNVEAQEAIEEFGLVDLVVYDDFDSIQSILFTGRDKVSPIELYVTGSPSQKIDTKITESMKIVFTYNDYLEHKDPQWPMMKLVQVKNSTIPKELVDDIHNGMYIKNAVILVITDKVYEAIEKLKNMLMRNGLAKIEVIPYILNESDPNYTMSQNRVTDTKNRQVIYVTNDPLTNHTISRCQGVVVAKKMTAIDDVQAAYRCMTPYSHSIENKTAIKEHKQVCAVYGTKSVLAHIEAYNLQASGNVEFRND